MSRRLLLLVLLSLALGLAGVSCVSQPTARLIQPEETTWIEKGSTTREEVEARLGPPTLASTVSGERGAGVFAEYAPPPILESPLGGAPLEPRPRGAFPQVYQPPIETLRPQASRGLEGPTFWIRYDARGVVEDFGFRTPAQEEAVPPSPAE